MHLSRPLLAVSLFCIAASAPAAPLHYLTLVNRAHAPATSVEVAASETDAFHALTLAGPIAGGGGQATVALRGTGCRVDLRITFKDRRRILYSNTDVCRGDRLLISALPAR